MTEPSWDYHRAAPAVLEEGLALRRRPSAWPDAADPRPAGRALEQALGVTPVHPLPCRPRADRGRPDAGALRAIPAGDRRGPAPGGDGGGGGAVGTGADHRLEVAGRRGAADPRRPARPPSRPRLDVRRALRPDVDLRRDADIAVRMAPPTQGALVARREARYGPPRPLRPPPLPRPARTPEAPDDLARHSVIGFDAETPFLRAMMRSTPALAEPASLPGAATARWLQLAALPGRVRPRRPLYWLRRPRPDLIRVLAGHRLGAADLRGDARGPARPRRCRVAFEALAEGMAAYCAE
ncbi:hypothetical protein ACU4GD_21505 [Cupriavidus basilensis]